VSGHGGVGDVVVTDFNGDAVWVLHNDGAGNFSATNATQISLAGLCLGPTAVALSRPSMSSPSSTFVMAVAGTLSNTVAILAGDGVGGFTVTQTLMTDGPPTGLAFGDLNFDGRVDLVVVTYEGLVETYLSDMTGNFHLFLGSTADIDTTVSPEGAIGIGLVQFTGNNDVFGVGTDQTEQAATFFTQDH
jgi:hypothetical protein